MSSTPPGVELLAQALAYARLALTAITTEDLARPTPCLGWSLADLLGHLDDALDAFAEAADGRVWLAPATPALLAPTAPAAAELQAKADALIGAWSHPAAVVHVGAAAVPAETLARAAALELAVHGNDVARSVRSPRAVRLRRLPAPLALALADVAGELAPAGGRSGRFDPPRPVPPGADASTRLLAGLGRDAGWSGGRVGDLSPD